MLLYLFYSTSGLFNYLYDADVRTVVLLASQQKSLHFVARDEEIGIFFLFFSPL